MTDFVLIVLNFLGSFLMSSKIGRYIMYIYVIYFITGFILLVTCTQMKHD